MWTIGLWFFAFLFAINGMLLFVADAFPSSSLVSPLNNQTITPPTQPQVLGNLTNINNTNPANATNSGDTVGIWDTVNYAWNQTIFVINLLTGGFIWQALAVFGLPTLVYQTVQGLIAFFMIITGLHFWRGIL
jgi:hypothetical protein